MNLLNAIKCQSKRALYAVGIEAHRFRPETSPLAQLIAGFRRFDIDLVLDVGANEGQFAFEIRTGGYSKRILSIEPMASAHMHLLQVSESDVDWQVHSRCAVGASTGEIDLYIAGNSVSSSVLPMLAAHIDAAPESAYQGRETVPMTTLDLIGTKYLDQAKSLFLKIDTQGYEWQVLDGAKTILPKVRGILMEISFVPLYEGQHLWRESIERLEIEGFVLWGLQPVFADPASGRILQMDALFFRA